MRVWRVYEKGHNLMGWLIELYTVLKNFLLTDPTLIMNSMFEPSHEIMVLFVLRKLILQMRMHSYPVGLDVWV